MNKNEFINKINSISNLQYLNEIFNIIKKNNCEYTFNNNGIFINFDNLNDNTKKEIDNFLKYIDKIDKILLNDNKNALIINEIKNNTDNNYKKTNDNIKRIKEENNKKILKKNLKNNEIKLSNSFIKILKNCKEIDKINTYEY